MNDLKILEQLYKGYHLEPKEIEQAERIIYALNTQISNLKN